MDDTKLESYISVREASDQTGFVAEWIRELAHKGEIKFKKVGHAMLIDSDSLKEYMENKAKKE